MEFPYIFLAILCFLMVFLLIERCLGKCFIRSTGPLSSLLWYFLHCETWVSQIFAPNIPKTSTTRLRVETWLSGATWHQNSPLQRQNVKRSPVTRKIQILRPNSPLSTLHATSGSQNQKSQKEETIAKNTTQKITNITWISDIPNSPLSLLCVTSGSQNLANHLTPSSLPDSHLHLSGKTWMDGSTHFIKIGIGCLFHKQKGPKVLW